LTIKGLTQIELRNLILSVGTGRSTRILSPVEVAQYCARAEVNREELADGLLLSKDQLVFFEKLLKLSSEYHPLVDWGNTGHKSLGFTSAAVIGGRIKDPKDQGMLVKAAMENKMTKADVIHVTQMCNKLGKSMEESIKSVLALKPVEKKVFIVMGAILPNDLQRELEKMTQYQRNPLLEACVRELVGLSDDFGARLGTNNFTLILNEEQRILVYAIDNIEMRISDLLLELVSLNK